jgi:GMP synthase (glutamine-hydrolysing)
MVAELKEKLQDDKVVLGLSGGVDSTVAAVLLHQAIGKIYTVFFVNNGLLRKTSFKRFGSIQRNGLECKGVDSGDRFLSELAGVSDPETKRKIIGRVF